MADEAKQQTAVEPEWFGRALELASTGMSEEEIADAVEKAPSTVRKMIRRKIEAGEFTPPAAGTVGGVTPTEPPADTEPPAEPAAATPVGTVTPEQAERQRQLAGDSSGDEVEPELFPFGSIDGDDFSHKSIGNAREPITEITVAMSGGEVPIPKGSGLLDPHKEGMLLVTYECQDGGLPVPIREGERGQKKIVGWKTRQRIRPTYIERVKGEEGVIEGHFAAMLEADATRAGALLDRLIVRAGRSLT